MNYNLPKPVCNVCGSDDSETFRQGDKSGIRCLKCGHEHIDNGWGIFDDTKAWTYDNKTGKFF